MMKTIGQRSLLTALSLTLALGASGAASAQQQAPDTQAQQSAPAQQPAPAQPGPGMGQQMMKDGMEHGKMDQQMGRKGMEGEHGRMGSGMKQDQSKDSAPTTGSNPSTPAPSTGSK